MRILFNLSNFFTLIPQQCNLGVLVKPQPGELNSDTVDYGKNVKLSVYIHAYPPPKMVWYVLVEEVSSVASNVNSASLRIGE